MKDLLVTGGDGQLGRAFRQTFPGAAVLGRYELDITDRQAVAQEIKARRPKVIVNAAAFTKVDDAEADPDRAYLVNVEGARYVAEAAQSIGTELVQVSTDYVYPGDKAAAYSETDATGPLSVYGKTKLEGESAAAAAYPQLLIVRTSWIFGDGHNFIRSIVSAAMSGVSEPSVVSDQKGLPTFAPHLANAIMALSTKAPSRGIYHLAGSGRETTWAELAESAIAAAGLPAKVKRISTAEYAASRPGPMAPRPANSVLDCAKAAAAGVTLPPWTEAVALYVRESLLAGR